MKDHAATDGGMELGSRRILHPGPLRWLRALGWMLALLVVLSFANLAASLAASQAFSVAGGWPELAVVAAICLVALGLYWLAVRFGEDRTPEEIAPAKALPDLAAGLLIGAAMFAAVMAILIGFGVYQISGPRPANAIGVVTMALESGVLEELILRAVVFRLLMRAFGPWWALAISAALFGAAHLTNPNATPMAAVSIAVEAGLMLAAFYMLTGRLWVSVGVHAAWNFTQAFIFGVPVSGFPSKDSLWVASPTPGVSDMLSGGAFGAEASPAAILVGTAVAVVVLWMAWRKGNFRPRDDKPAAAEAS